MRTIFITEEIISTSGEDSLVRRITEQLLVFEAQSEKDPIHVFLDTNGGDIKVALCLFDLFKMCKAPIHTYGLSEVSSAGILIFLAGSKRFSFKHTQFMSHPSTISMTASSVDFESTADTLVSQGSKVKEIFKTVLRISEKKFKELHSRTNYMWADEALKLKIVTDILKELPSIGLENGPDFSEKDMEYIDKAVTYYKASKQQLLSMEV